MASGITWQRNSTEMFVKLERGQSGFHQSMMRLQRTSKEDMVIGSSQGSPPRGNGIHWPLDLSSPTTNPPPHSLFLLLCLFQSSTTSCCITLVWTQSRAAEHKRTQTAVNPLKAVRAELRWRCIRAIWKCHNFINNCFLWVNLIIETKWDINIQRHSSEQPAHAANSQCSYRPFRMNNLRPHRQQRHQIWANDLKWKFALRSMRLQVCLLLVSESQRESCAKLHYGWSKNISVAPCGLKCQSFFYYVLFTPASFFLCDSHTLQCECKRSSKESASSSFALSH